MIDDWAMGMAILDVIQTEGGKISKDILIKRLEEKSAFNEGLFSGMQLSSHLELILQDLLFSKLIRIEFDHREKDYWVPADARQEFFLCNNDVIFK